MPVLFPNPRMPVVVVLVGEVLAGVFGVNGIARSATESLSSPDQGFPAVTPKSPRGSDKALEGNGNRPMRKACADDARRFCPDLKAGGGRIAECLKQHTQELSQGCADMVQRHDKHR